MTFWSRRLRPPASTRRRRGWARRLLPLLFAIPLAFGAVGGLRVAPTAGDDLADALAKQQQLAATIAAQQRQVAALNAQQASLQNQITTTRNQLATISTNLTTVRQEIATLTVQIANVAEQYRELLAELDSLRIELTQVEAQEVQKEVQLEARKAELVARVQDAYRAQQTPLLETLLSAQSFADIVSQISEFADLGQQDHVLALQIQADQQALATLHATVLSTKQATQTLADATAAQKARLDAQNAELAAANARLIALQKQLDAQLAAQKAAATKLASNKAQLEAAIKSNGAAQADLAKKIDALIAAQQSFSDIPSAYNGSLQWPMGGVITQEFGCTGVISEPPLGDCPHFHTGIDIAAPYGTPVHAAGDGVVVFVGYNPYDTPPQAWIVIIAHSDSLETWYAHMEPIKPAGIFTGATVSAGEVIGYEGMTGHTTGPHLHWAVRLNGTFVNPRLFV